MYERFEALDTVVVAVSQEDEDLSLAARMAQTVEAPFDIAFDLQRKKSFAYDRTTAYLIDKRGIVRQVFPTLAYSRPSWEAILSEADRIMAPSEEG